MIYKERSIDETHGILYKFIEQRSDEFTKITITHASLGRFNIEIVKENLK